MTTSLLKCAIVPGLLSMIGPFAMDMYLPAMPGIAADLGTSAQAMQGTITAFGLAQLVYGPWADQSGRKPPLYAALAIFALGSVLCILAPTAQMLTLGCVVQGLGGAAVMVTPRTIIRDMSTGDAPDGPDLAGVFRLVHGGAPDRRSADGSCGLALGLRGTAGHHADEFGLASL